jgi:DNA repair exonuclease SbcCD ATPase subunit
MLTGTQADQKKAQDRLSKLEGKETSTCRECGMVLTEEHLQREKVKAQEKLNTLTADVAFWSKSLDAAKGAYDKAVSNKNIAESIKTGMDRALASLETTLKRGETLEADIAKVMEAGISNKKNYEASKARMEAELKILEAGKSESEAKRAELKQAIDGLSAEVQKVVVSITQYSGEIQSLNRQVSECEARAKGLQEKLDRAEKARAEVGKTEEDLKAAETDLAIKVKAYDLMSPKGGLPSFLLDAQLPHIEARCNEYLSRLGMGNLQIKMDTLDGDKESLVVLVENGSAPSLDIAAYSGGQLGRVEIALKQALADLIASSRGTTLQFLFYDEPTDGLDEAGKSALLDFLWERSAERFATTMVVSHDPKLLHAFQNRLTVVLKANGATAIEAM